MKKKNCYALIMMYVFINLWMHVFTNLHLENLIVYVHICMACAAISRYSYAIQEISVELDRVAESQAGVRPVTGRPARSDKLMLLNNLLKIHG